MITYPPTTPSSPGVPSIQIYFAVLPSVIDSNAVLQIYLLKAELGVSSRDELVGNAHINCYTGLCHQLKITIERFVMEELEAGYVYLRNIPLSQEIQLPPL